MDEESKQLIHKLNRCIYLYKYKNKLEKREEEYKKSILKLKGGILLQHLKIRNMVSRDSFLALKNKHDIESRLLQLNQITLSKLEFKDNYHVQKSENNKNYELIIENLNGVIKDWERKFKDLNSQFIEEQTREKNYAEEISVLKKKIHRLKKKKRKNLQSNSMSEMHNLKEREDVLKKEQKKIEEELNRKNFEWKKIEEELNRKNFEWKKIEEELNRKNIEQKKMSDLLKKEKEALQERNSFLESENNKIREKLKEKKNRSSSIESLNSKIDEIISSNHKNNRLLKSKMRNRSKEHKDYAQNKEVENFNKNNAKNYFTQIMRLKNEIIKRLTVYADRARKAQFEQRSLSVYDHSAHEGKPNVPRALNIVPQIINTDLMDIRAECERNLETLHSYTDDRWYTIYEQFQKSKSLRSISKRTVRSANGTTGKAYEKIRSIINLNTLQCDLDFRENIRDFIKKLDGFKNPEVVRLNINLGIANKYVDEMIEIKKIIERNSE